MHFSQLFGEQKTQGKSYEESAKQAAEAFRATYMSLRKAGFDEEQAMRIVCAMIQGASMQK